MRTSVDEYIGALPEWQAKIAGALRQSIKAASPKLDEAIKWAQPVYEINGPVCYFKAQRNHVTFGFWRGAQLMKMDNRLETSGSTMAHMKIAEGDDVRPRKVTAL